MMTLDIKPEWIEAFGRIAREKIEVWHSFDQLGELVLPEIVSLIRADLEAENARLRETPDATVTGGMSKTGTEPSWEVPPRDSVGRGIPPRPVTGGAQSEFPDDLVERCALRAALRFEVVEASTSDQIKAWKAATIAVLRESLPLPAPPKDSTRKAAEMYFGPIPDEIERREIEAEALSYERDLAKAKRSAK